MVAQYIKIRYSRCVILKSGSRKTKGLFFIIVVFGLYGAGLWFGRPAEADYSNLNWDRIPSVIAISPVEQNEYSGVLFIRLQDGVEQFIPGTWETSFSEQGNVYVFGSYPEEYPIEEKKKLYEIFQGESILDIDLQNTEGDILAVEENQQGTYLLVKIKKNQTTYFCIAERMGQVASECDELNLFGEGNATWDPQQEHQVVVQNSAGEILTYDPWNPGLMPVTAEEAPEQYAYLESVLTGQAPEMTNTPKLFHVLQWIVGVANQKPFVYRVPVGSSAKLITDQTHAVVVGKKTIRVIELDTGKAVQVYTHQKMQEKVIKFRSVAGEEYL